MPDANLRQYANDAALRNGIPTDYFSRFISTESSWNPSAQGVAGEIGIAQIIPANHPDISNPLDPYESIDYAASTIRGYFDKFGSWSSTFGAWNAGPSRAESGKLPKSTVSYIDKIIGGASPIGRISASETVIGSIPDSGSFRIFVYIIAIGLLIIGIFGSARGKTLLPKGKMT